MLILYKKQLGWSIVFKVIIMQLQLNYGEFFYQKMMQVSNGKLVFPNKASRFYLGW